VLLGIDIGMGSMTEATVTSGKWIENFGRNVRFRARYCYCPRTQAEVLAVLARHAGQKIRVIGSLHSWSDVTACPEVILDMRRLNRVEVRSIDDGTAVVIAEAGCNLQRLLNQIHAASDATLPTLGAIKRQTISGAISTATHGSGRHSLSHYVESIRVAAYDSETGRARVFEWSNGPQLLAARCALGCMGVILSVSLRAVRKYRVTETVVRRESLEEILADENDFPLQQFVLVPHLWAYYQFQRLEITEAATWRGKLNALLYRTYKLVGVDIGFHLMLKTVLELASFCRWDGLVRWFYRRIVPLTFIQGWSVNDESEPALTMRHYLFTHTEIELFVPSRHVRAAAYLIRHSAELFAGNVTTVPTPLAEQLQHVNLLDGLVGLRGTYTHHYPIVFRKVLPEDTLISMTGGVSEPYYTISLFTYRRPGNAFHAFARFFALALTRLFQARLHWGKYFPLQYHEIRHLYPRLEEFRSACQDTDPAGVFRNAYTHRVLGWEGN
jgi:FAD/FMN-containing dehydrogenase